MLPQVDFDSSWILYAALTLLPFSIGIVGFAFSALRRHRMRAIVSLGVILLMTGGAVAAYESENDGEYPTNIDEIQQVPTSVKNVVTRNVANVMGEVSPLGTPQPTPRPQWRPMSEGSHSLVYNIAKDKLEVAVSCARQEDAVWRESTFYTNSGYYVPPDKARIVYVSRGDYGNMDAYERACAKLG